MQSDLRPRVLCVDDDPNVLAALRRQLRHRYEVVLAEGATLGLARLQDAGPFAVIVSDLHMPGMDGLTFLREARVIAPDAVAILMTGSIDTQGGVEAESCSGLVFRQLAKPCLPNELWASIDEAVAEHERGAPV